jgi:threonine aldolase
VSSSSIASGSGGGRFDQAFVVERAACARRVVERVEDHAEALAQRAQIGFLAQGAGSDQHAVGADAQRGGSILGGLDHIAGEQRAHAINFRTGAGAPCVAGGKFIGPGIDRGTGGLAK